MKTNNIYLGDCMELMNGIPSGSVDAVICDPPYGTTRNRWDSVLPFEALWRQYERIVKETGPVILFGQGMFTARLMMSKPGWWRYNLVWNKTQPSGFLNAHRMPLRSPEDICVFYRKLPVYHPIMTKGVRKVSAASSKKNCVRTTNYGSHGLKDYDSDMRYPTSVLSFPKDVQHSAIHPTQKPVALIEWLIQTFTNPGDIVLDNCSGSGTTAIASMNAQRRYICIENDPEYYRLSLARVEHHLRTMELYNTNER